MRHFMMALVCCSLWACASDSETPAPDSSLPAATLVFGAACTDSSQCLSQLCLKVSDTRSVCSAACVERSTCPAGESWDCVQPTGASALLCACTSNAATEICGDGRDNDCDGVTDCPTDGNDGGIIDSGTPDASQDSGMCPTGDCEPEPTCETDPGLCGLCQVNLDCDDGKPCTEDLCRGAGCVHIPRDASCGATEICDPRDATGCVAATACAADGDCADDDACTRAEYCDTTAAICRMGFLDADGDQHLPMVCGGDDCNDDDERAYPGALDICDGRDNDCDGMIDPPSAALLCAHGRMCQLGACVCNAGLQECNSSCVDPASFQTDEVNCGGCGIDCFIGEVCVAGLCEDVDECEDDDPCPEHSTCVNYEPGYDCECNDGYTELGGGCIDFDECAADTDHCDDEPEACTNVENGFECECPAGYTGTGVGIEGCLDVDECEEPVCPGDNTACFNDAGTFECGCADGFIVDAGGACGNYNECARQIDECDHSPGECTDTVGGYDCTCPSTHIEVGEGHGDLGCASRVIGLSTGSHGQFNCALLAGGRVQCWGDSSSGQLGLGSTAARGDSTFELVDEDWLTDLGTSRTAKALAVGASHACAILDNDSVKCWGANGAGQLGQGNTSNRGDAVGELGDALVAVALGTGRTAKAIAAGYDHTCAILDDNTLKCWGGNGYGQLGRDNTTSRGNGINQMGDNLAAINLGAGRTAKKVTAGFGHTCAILDDDTVKCWGLNNLGQLGLETNANRGDGAGEMAALPAVNLGTGLTAKAISAANSHTCVILNTDAVKCWGANNYGQLGINSNTARGDGAGEMGDALAVAILGAGRTAKTIVGGDSQTCAILDNNALKCWGYGASAMLGLGNTLTYGNVAGSMELLTPVDVGTGRTVVALRVGVDSTCALLDNQRVKCWGTNDRGQLGIGNTATIGSLPAHMGDALQYVRLGS